MKKLLTIAALLGLAVSTSFAAASAKSWTDGLSVNGSIGYESEFLFRGVKVTTNSLVTSLEGSYKLYNGSLYAGVLSHNGLSATYGESDLYIGFKAPVAEKLTADVGYTFYWYTQQPSAIDRSNEIYAGVTYNGFYVNPAAYVYYDINLEQVTAEVSGKYSFDLAKYGWANSALDVGAYVGVVSADDISAGQGTEAKNGYAYSGATADVVYSFSKTSAASVGVRVGGNNDNNGNESNLFWGAKYSAGF